MTIVVGQSGYNIVDYSGYNIAVDCIVDYWDCTVVVRGSLASPVAR